MRHLILPLALMTATAMPAALAECDGSAKTDACLVGDWLMQDGGPMAWMKQQMGQTGAAITFSEFTQKPVDPAGALHFKADGTFTVDPIRTRMVGAGSQGGMDMTLVMESVASSSGRWSVSGDQLNLCTDKQDLKGSMKMSMGGMTHEMPTQNPGPGKATFAYQCQGKTLQTRFEVEGAEPMTSVFTRQ